MDNTTYCAIDLADTPEQVETGIDGSESKGVLRMWSWPEVNSWTSRKFGISDRDDGEWLKVR